ncbi:MAG: hypothetical protein SGJ15_13400 [Bacteroidota bacterium]|nr:hypothetical protein [Bacteroidota bacterium]
MLLKQKGKEWLGRYLPSEIIGTITAVGGAVIAQFFYGNKLISAYTGSVCEALGFYSTLFIQSSLNERRKKKLKNTTFYFNDYFNILKNMVLEFGPAGLIDGLILRPFFMYLFPLVITNFAVGVFLGKIAGDIMFYVIVIYCYERLKRKASSK